MGSLERKTLVYILITALVFIPFAGTALAEENYMKEDISAEKVAADLLIVRPVSFVGTVFGSVLYVLSLPFTLTAKLADEEEDSTNEIMKENLDELIGDPLKYTFQRRLGDF